MSHSNTSSNPSPNVPSPISGTPNTKGSMFTPNTLNESYRGTVLEDVPTYDEHAMSTNSNSLHSSANSSGIDSEDDGDNWLEESFDDSGDERKGSCQLNGRLATEVEVKKARKKKRDRIRRNRRMNKQLDNSKHVIAQQISASGLPIPITADEFEDEEDESGSRRPSHDVSHTTSHNKSMEVSFASVTAGVARYRENKERENVCEELRTLLNNIDADKDGFLTKDQIVMFSKQMGFVDKDMCKVAPEFFATEKVDAADMSYSMSVSIFTPRTRDDDSNPSSPITGSPLNSSNRKKNKRLVAVENLVQRMADITHGPVVTANDHRGDTPRLEKRHSILKTIKASKNVEGADEVATGRATLLVRLQAIIGDVRRAQADATAKRAWDMLHYCSMIYFYLMASYFNIFLFQRENTFVHATFIICYIGWAFDIILTTQLATSDETRKVIMDRKDICWRKRHILAIDGWGALPLDIFLYHFAGLEALVVVRIFKFIKLLRANWLFEAVNLDRVTPGMVTFFFQMRPMFIIIFWSVIFTHSLTIIFYFTHNEINVFSDGHTNANSNMAAYLDMLVLTLAMLTGAGVGVDLNTEGDRFLGPMMIVCGYAIQGIVIGKLAVLIFRTDVASRNLQILRETLNIIEHYKLPRSTQSEILSFQMHSLNDSISQHMEDLETLPDTMRREIAVYMKVDGINQVRLFAEAERDCRVALAAKLDRVLAEPEVDIVSIGDVGHHMYLLSHGYATVIIVTGAQVLTLTRGDYFGEVALMNETCTRQATVRSLTYCDLWSLHKEDFLMVLKEYPSLFNAMLGEMEKKGVDISFLKSLQSLEDAVPELDSDEEDEEDEEATSYPPSPFAEKRKSSQPRQSVMSRSSVVSRAPLPLAPVPEPSSPDNPRRQSRKLSLEKKPSFGGGQALKGRTRGSSLINPATTNAPFISVTSANATSSRNHDGLTILSNPNKAQVDEVVVMSHPNKMPTVDPSSANAFGTSGRGATGGFDDGFGNVVASIREDVFGHHENRTPSPLKELIRQKSEPMAEAIAFISNELAALTRTVDNVQHLVVKKLQLDEDELGSLRHNLVRTPDLHSVHSEPFKTPDTMSYAGRGITSPKGRSQASNAPTPLDDELNPLHNSSMPDEWLEDIGRSHSLGNTALPGD